MPPKISREPIYETAEVVNLNFIFPNYVISLFSMNLLSIYLNIYLNSEAVCYDTKKNVRSYNEEDLIMENLDIHTKEDYDNKLKKERYQIDDR